MIITELSGWSTHAEKGSLIEQAKAKRSIHLRVPEDSLAPSSVLQLQRCISHMVSNRISSSSLLQDETVEWQQLEFVTPPPPPITFVFHFLYLFKLRFIKIFKPPLPAFPEVVVVQLWGMLKYFSS